MTLLAEYKTQKFKKTNKFKFKNNLQDKIKKTNNDKKLLKCEKLSIKKGIHSNYWVFKHKNDHDYYK